MGGAICARELLDVAQRLKIEMVRLPLDGFDESEYRRVIGAFVENGVGGVIVPPMAEFWTSRHSRDAVSAANEVPDGDQSQDCTSARG
jgi:hypothetical protein